jgi:hypothetical protein
MKCIFFFLAIISLSCQNNQSVKQVRGGTITIQEYDTPPSKIEMSLSEEDSLLYHEVVADYGNYWETKTSKTFKKQVLFDLYSGKIVIYNNRTTDLKYNDASSDAYFSWEMDTINPYKIKGIYSEIEKDTLLFWNYNPKTKVLVDEKGLVFKRKKIKSKN